EPKLTISGTTVMPQRSASSGGMSDAESVTIATFATGTPSLGRNVFDVGSTGCADCARLRHPLEGHRDGSATAEAQRREAIPSLARVGLGAQRRPVRCAARADGMAGGDRPAVDVHLRPVEAELATVGESLGSERFVDLDQVERLDRQLHLGKQLLDALDRRQE